MIEPRFSFQVDEAGGGPYIFMVHGMLSSRLQWAPNVAAVAQLARPVVFELWGHGRSPTPADTRLFEIEAWVEQLEQARVELGAEKILLCGQSLGAALTLRYALRHPERVLAQVFTNSISALSEPDRFELNEERLATIAGLERDGRTVLANLPVHPARARRLSPEVREMLVHEADRVDPVAVARIMRITAPQLSLAPLLAGTRCPTLLVNGLREKGFQPLRQRASELIAGCQVVDIDAGHAVNLEAPEAFNAAVTGFLRSVLA